MLRAHGVATWYAEEDIPTAEKWEESIRRGLESCDWFLVVMSPRSLASRWVKAEVLWAMDERPKRIVPVLLEDCNWHDFHLPLEAAVAAPRIHHQLLPPNTLFEEPYATLDPAAHAALSARGYTFVNQGWNGDIQVIVVGDSGATAVADPRGRGAARVLSPGKARSD